MQEVRLVNYSRLYFDLSKNWISDPELNRLIDAGELPSDINRELWYESLPFRSDYKIWGCEYGGRPIGVCGLKRITSHNAEYWGYIGEKSLWGQGIGGGYILAIQKFAKEFGLNSIYLKVLKFNARAINLYIKYGFKIDKEDSNWYFMSLLL